MPVVVGNIVTGTSASYKNKKYNKINLKTKVLTTIFMSCLFVFATGLTAPSLRALVMVNTSLLSEYFSKNFSVRKSILLSLFILTLINPLALVYSASLHLSYLAIFGLVFLLPKLLKIDEQIFEIGILLNVFKTNFTKSLLATFLAITVSVGPYLLAMSEQINFAGTVASVILEPIILGVTILTFLTTFTSFVSNFFAQILGVLNTFLVSIILHTADFLSENIFILNYSINHTFVKIYYFVFVIYFFVLNFDTSD
jgi:competence protein ComEC